jgi:two-component system, NtrC family, nitrogen regulation response regulator NtrX
MMNSRPHILVVEDEKAYFEELRLILSAFHLEHAPNLRSAGVQLANQNFDLVLLDLNLDSDQPDSVAGLAYLEKIQQKYPILPVIIMSKHDDYQKIIAAIRQGAIDYFHKATPVYDVWRNRIQQLVQVKRLTEDQYPFKGKSEAFENLRSRLIELEPHSKHLLFLGEIGVGKEAAARFFHANSKRRFHPFSYLDFSSYDQEEEVVAKLERWKEGIVMIKRLDRLTPRAQAFLAGYFRQQKQGGVKGNLQFVATALPSLKEAIREGGFRSDLFFEFTSIDLPPLRERPEDIVFLHNFYLRREDNPPLKQLTTPEARRMLLAYLYPNNVRDLQRIQQEMLANKRIQNRKLVDSACLPTEVVHPESNNLAFAPHEFRKAAAFTTLTYLEDALRQTYSQKGKAAAQLEISLDDLRYQVTKHHKEFPELFRHFPTLCTAYKLEL